MPNVTGYHLSVIYNVLLKLANSEGCTVLETLLTESPDEGQRIYDEVFSVENMVGE